ncbi:hypothetical protein BDB13_1431 [Rhodococcus sp. OK302]|jgi:hypothetical protein|nr:hypothetical protein BDB13_1431 [Rhodococcus sp. OK302]
MLTDIRTSLAEKSTTEVNTTGTSFGLHQRNTFDQTDRKKVAVS